MNRYAVVEDGVVTNVVLWDGVTPFEHQETSLPVPEECSIGWSYVEGEWVAPTPSTEELVAIAEDEAEAAAQAALRAAGLAKLIALGLTEEEALALVGG